MRNVPWTLFCTLTFAEGDISKRRRYAAFHAWIRLVADSYRIPSKHLLWCGRHENGELNGRPHFHALLAGLRAKTTKQDIFRCLRLWEGLKVGFGLVRRFENTSDGVDYILKPAKREHTNTSDGLTSGILKSSRSGAGADAFEAARFDSRASEVEIGSGVWDYVAKRRGMPVPNERRSWRIPASERGKRLAA